MEMVIKMEILTLRGHHLLCSRLFSGYGYSEDFVRRMGEVVSRTGLKNYKVPIEYDKVEKVRLICSHDYVCQKCPNMINENTRVFCDLGDEDVRSKDKKTLEYAGLKENHIYTLEEIESGVEKITEEQFAEICGTCRWFKAGYCMYERLVKIRD